MPPFSGNRLILKRLESALLGSSDAARVRGGSGVTEGEPGTGALICRRSASRLITATRG